MTFLNALSFERLLWLVPVFLTIHNMEEAPFMERWYKRLPVKIPLAITMRHFVVAVTLITLGGFVLTFVGVEYLANHTGFLIVLGIQAVMLLNAFVPHIVTTFRFRMYSPGVITAVFITLPFSYYLFDRAFSENILSWSQFWILLGISPFAVALIALSSLQLAKVFDKKTA